MKFPPIETQFYYFQHHTDPEPSNSPPHHKFLKFFSNGLWLCRTSYSKDVCLYKWKVRSAISATVGVLLW